MRVSHEGTKRRSHEAMLLASLVLLIAIPVSGCRRADDLSPPKIAYGQAECEACKMIISEEPFAAAAVVTTSTGVQKFAFDDIGCLLEFLRELNRTGEVRAYVHDHGALVWLDARQAVFIRGESLQTPMGSHLAASASQDAATKLLRRFPGTALRFEQLQSEVAGNLASDSTSNERTMP
jgi:copper chaperone NosL